MDGTATPPVMRLRVQRSLTGFALTVVVLKPSEARRRNRSFLPLPRVQGLTRAWKAAGPVAIVSHARLPRLARRITEILFRSPSEARQRTFNGLLADPRLGSRMNRAFGESLDAFSGLGVASGGGHQRERCDALRGGQANNERRWVIGRGGSVAANLGRGDPVAVLVTRDDAADDGAAACGFRRVGDERVQDHAMPAGDEAADESTGAPSGGGDARRGETVGGRLRRQTA